MTMSIEKRLQKREVIFLDDVNELRESNVKICSTKGNDIVKKHRYLCQLNNNIVTTKGASASLNTATSYFDYFLDRLSFTSLT